jgi:hypothetical protein
MTTVTINLPDALAQRAGGAARAIHRPLEEVITVMLEGVLPSLDDVPQDMQAELVEMTWWDDARLMVSADSALAESEQRRLAVLSAIDKPSNRQSAELEILRRRYGEVTLRKARATALLSIRSGKRLLADADSGR